VALAGYFAQAAATQQGPVQNLVDAVHGAGQLLGRGWSKRGSVPRSCCGQRSSRSFFSSCPSQALCGSVMRRGGWMGVA